MDMSAKNVHRATAGAAADESLRSWKHEGLKTLNPKTFEPLILMPETYTSKSTIPGH